MVELATVHRLVRLYPWALAVLAALLVVQLASAVTASTVGARVLATLVAVVTVLLA